MRFLLSFLVFFGTWILLSGKLDLFHLCLGIISSLVVAFWSGDLLFADKKISVKRKVVETGRFIPYAIWLLYEIFLANLHVIYLALHPRMKDLINPKIIRFKSKLHKEFSLYVMGNSITLTPGTVTIAIEGNEFIVHSITDKAAEGLPGKMENRIAQVFGD